MNEDRIDKLIDRALNEYCEARPRAGLEQRILANLDSQADQHRLWRWRWAAVPLLALLVIVAVLLGLGTRTPKQIDGAQVPETKTIVAAVPEKAPVSAAHQRVRPQRRLVHRDVATVAQQASPAPRLETFPSRDGDDDIVRLAVRFVQAQPDIAAQITQEQKDFRQMAETFTAPLTGSSKQKNMEER